MGPERLKNGRDNHVDKVTVGQPEVQEKEYTEENEQRKRS